MFDRHIFSLNVQIPTIYTLILPESPLLNLYGFHPSFYELHMGFPVYLNNIQIRNRANRSRYGIHYRRNHFNRIICLSDICNFQS